MVEFLAISPEEFADIDCRFTLIPFPMETTVSYGAGTRRGPEALFAASREVELFDTEYGHEVIYDYGFKVLPIPDIPAETEAALAILEASVGAVLAEGRIPVTLGGEHTVTCASVRAVKKQNEDLTIVQFDAHLDLRDRYLDDPYSHACAMRRCLDDPMVSLISIGVRNVSAEESTFLNTVGRGRVRVLDIWNCRQSFLASLAELVRNQAVYITFDADALDPSIMPSTGTPEPDGILWADAMAILQTLCAKSKVVGFDYVEHAPIPQLHAPDFLGARLIYKAMSYIHSAPPPLSEYPALR